MKQISRPVNEPVLPYSPGDSARESLQTELKRMSQERIDIPCIIGGKEIRTENKRTVRMPHSHSEILADFYYAGKKELLSAVDASLKAQAEWQRLSWFDRAQIFLKAADLLSGPWRNRINAATMLGQSKNAFQSEIDAICELADFWRFNAYFYQNIQKEQPISVPGVYNSVDYRPLEGFVLAITPFNFTAIAMNLPSLPAMLGNTVVWKPSDTQVLSAYWTYKLLEEAGLPPGVINFVPADGPLTSEVLVTHPELGGVHFTGSTSTFISLNQTVAQNLGRYRGFPRMVGETGGKDFVFAHPSADPDVLITALVRGAFEYQGQKCSAASRAYIPQSLWKKIKAPLIETINSLKMGDTRDFSNFINAVIDERSFKKIMGFIERSKNNSAIEILAGGVGDSSKGWFIRPTLLQTQDPKSETMTTEIFGPVLSVFVYEDSNLLETLKICDETSPYALTGAIIAQDRLAIVEMTEKLRNSAGNLYINDKCTGAVVGQQPFGGARMSGTNDKAGSPFHLLRFLSPRTIKEVSVPPKDYRYPFLG
jgi:1-pyrroline-5-carboxylate dehydrogenase